VYDNAEFKVAASVILKSLAEMVVYVARLAALNPPSDTAMDSPLAIDFDWRSISA